MGCKADCSGALPGWTCSGGSVSGPDTCTSLCGDGYTVGTETCDDHSDDGIGCLVGC